MRKYLNYLKLSFVSVFLLACETAVEKTQPTLFLGADLSYVNEVEDCGGQFFENGTAKDPYQLFADKKANLVRLRLWHTPDWTNYGTLPDVKKSIARAKRNGMKVLLDFHYSDNWADPAHQIIPALWSGITDTQVLGDSLYNYTTAVIEELYAENLLPEFIQVGNETNSEILMEKPTAENSDTDWIRNASLLKRGLQAVDDFNSAKGMDIHTMLHVAQPDNAKWWFEQAAKQNLDDFDWIGLSYYPNWSEYDLSELSEMIAYLKTTYQKEVMVVEAGYPYTYRNIDDAGNVLGQGAELAGYPVSPEGQLSFMVDLTSSVINGGGRGVVYWEAAWISTPCKTQWGTGSHWENAAFFDATQGNEALPVFNFFNHIYKFPETVANP